MEITTRKKASLPLTSTTSTTTPWRPSTTSWPRSTGDETGRLASSRRHFPATGLGGLGLPGRLRACCPMSRRCPPPGPRAPSPRVSWRRSPRGVELAAVQAYEAAIDTGLLSGTVSTWPRSSGHHQDYADAPRRRRQPGRHRTRPTSPARRHGPQLQDAADEDAADPRLGPRERRRRDLLLRPGILQDRDAARRRHDPARGGPARRRTRPGPRPGTRRVRPDLPGLGRRLDPAEYPVNASGPSEREDRDHELSRDEVRRQLRRRPRRAPGHDGPRWQALQRPAPATRCPRRPGPAAGRPLPPRLPEDRWRHRHRRRRARRGSEATPTWSRAVRAPRAPPPPTRPRPSSTQPAGARRRRSRSLAVNTYQTAIDSGPDRHGLTLDAFVPFRDQQRRPPWRALQQATEDHAGAGTAYDDTNRFLQDTVVGPAPEALTDERAC